MLKLKLQYFGHLMQRDNLLEKMLMLGKIEGRRKSGWQRMRWLDGIIDSMDMSFEQTLGDCEGQGSLPCCIQEVAKNRTPLSNWTTTTISPKTGCYLLYNLKPSPFGSVAFFLFISLLPFTLLTKGQVLSEIWMIKGQYDIYPALQNLKFKAFILKYSPHFSTLGTENAADTTEIQPKVFLAPQT